MLAHCDYPKRLKFPCSLKYFTCADQLELWLGIDDCLQRENSWDGRITNPTTLQIVLAVTLGDLDPTLSSVEFEQL